MWDDVALLGLTWREVVRLILHPYWAGFYVPVAIVIFAGIQEARAHSRGSHVRYDREFFVLASELCLGAISIVLIATVVHFWLQMLEHPQPAPFRPEWLIPAFAFDALVWRIAWETRRDAIRTARGAQMSVVGQAGTAKRVSRLEVAAALLTGGLLLAVNTAIFQDPDTNHANPPARNEGATHGAPSSTNLI